MPTRRVLHSVLHDFLGTFTSRYSDYRGYWLFGQLPNDIDQWSIDLLGDSPSGDTPTDAAHRLAHRRFAEQMQKSGLGRSVVREAMLRFERDPQPILGRRGEHEAWGSKVTMVVRVVTDVGSVIERRQTIFVAAHDPDQEGRRRPEDWGK